MAELEVTTQEGIITLRPCGNWVATTVGRLKEDCDQQLSQAAKYKKILVDLSHIESVDISGVWLLEKTINTLKKSGIDVLQKGKNQVFENLQKQLEEYEPIHPPTTLKRSFFTDHIVDLGKSAVEVFFLACSMVMFLGEVIVNIFIVIFNPKRLRFTALFSQMERIGINALPIITLMSVAIAMILAYQGEEQLRRFGAQIYTINLVSISIVREVGILITAILVAGRSGSAITAQIGTMKINQELDALLTLGLNPLEVLIIPRILALVLIMPFLAFFADIAGLVGGGIMVVTSLDVSPQLYIYQAGEAITKWGFWIGIIKAPIFGFIIGIVSCFEGLQVGGTAESIGKRTTNSVVESIFLVTIVDALFSIFFSKLGI